MLLYWLGAWNKRSINQNVKTLGRNKFDKAEAPSIDSPEQFRTEVIGGLTSTPKRLSSKYFYDKKGDELFQQIMECPEYYLTRCELDIFQNQRQKLAALIVGDDQRPFDLIELGVGDGTKTQFLLRELVERKSDFNYLPVDISGNILLELEKNLSYLGGLSIEPLQGEYLNALQEATTKSDNRKVVLFLGGNIGNMDMKEARKFCQQVRALLQPGDLFLIGFDLRKNPETILNAYNDKTGITREFNLNLLQRINNELEGEFDLDQFSPYPTYDPVSGACKSFLISKIDQQIKIGTAEVHFKEGEWIYMEISQKYSQDEISEMAEKSDFAVIGSLSDGKNWFVDSVWAASPLENQIEDMA